MRRAFTLMEILIAVMLTGMLATLALAPVVVTVRRVVETQKNYSDISALSRTMNFIARDLAAAVRLSTGALIINNHEDMIRGDDDTMLIMSYSITAQNLAAGTLVYKIDEGNDFNKKIIPGLYRWVFPGKSPNQIRPDSLKADEGGQLVLPGLVEFNVEVPTDSREDNRRKDYRGGLPAGIYIRLNRGEPKNKIAQNFNDNEENIDELERFFVFP